MRIGVLTFHRACNSGAMLQAYALQTVLQRMGHKVCFPDCNTVGYLPRIPRFHSSYKWPRRTLSYLGWLRLAACGLMDTSSRAVRHNAFAKKYLQSIRDNGHALESKFDLLVFGSDQIWNPKCFGEEKADEIPLFLGETSGTCRKLSYAACIGDKPLSDVELARLKKSVRSFSALSVRDAMSGNALLDASGRKARLVVDPTLLLERDEWETIASTPIPDEKQRFVVAYTACLEDGLIHACGERAKRELGMPVKYRLMYGEGNPFGPREFVASFRDCASVMANSFHGMVFALIFRKPFVVVRDQIDEVDARQVAFMRELGIEGRLVNPGNIDGDWHGKLLEPVPEYCYERLDAMRTSSLAWLEGAVNEVEGGCRSRRIP